MIEEVPTGEGKRSALTCIRFRGFVEPTLDLWIHEVAKSDLPICKEKGDPMSVCCG
jgi:hypothetical protein